MFEDRSGGELATELLDLYAQKAMLEARIARTTAAVEEQGDHLLLDPDAAPVRLSTWLAGQLRVRPGLMRRDLARARALTRLPETMAGFEGGLFSASHVDAITPIVGLLESVDGAGLAQLDEKLSDVAVVGSVADLVGLVAQLQHAKDPDEAALSAHERENTHHLGMSRFGDGSLALNGTLTPAAAAVVLKAIDAVSAPNGEDDTRTQGQRRADGLVEVCRRALDRGELAPKRRVRPNVTVLMPLSTLLDEDNNPGAFVPGVGHLDGAVARALACDAVVRRATIDDINRPDWLPGFLLGPSALLDLGRSVRTCSDDQFHGLIVRDRHCAYPGCERPPDWCEAHHMDEWQQDGGKTDLDRMCLLCEEHHHAIHRQQLIIVRNPDGTYRTQRRHHQEALAA